MGNKYRKQFWIRPGYIVIDFSSASGGVHYSREAQEQKKKRGRKGTRISIQTSKTIDHVEVVTAIDALVKRADYACRKHCARTIFGWFADEVSLRALKKEIAVLRKEAAELNAIAKAAGSARRVRVGIVPTVPEVKEATQEVAATIREVLADVHTALRTGCVVKQVDAADNVLMHNNLHGPLLKTRNLDRLMVGEAQEVLLAALDRISGAKREIVYALREGQRPEIVGAAVDLSAIEAAITWFTVGVSRGRRSTARKNAASGR